MIHHTSKPSKTKGRRRRLHCDWHKESRTKDSNAGEVMDAIIVFLYITGYSYSNMPECPLCAHTGKVEWKGANCGWFVTIEEIAIPMD